MNNGGVNRPKGIFDYSLYMYIPVYEEDIKMGRWYTLCRRLTALAAVFMMVFCFVIPVSAKTTENGVAVYVSDNE